MHFYRFILAIPSLEIQKQLEVKRKQTILYNHISDLNTMQANKIIIIHPGSRNLRIGRASDLNPITILHAIGRRRRECVDNQPLPIVYRDTLLPAMQNSSLPEFIDYYLQIRQNVLPHNNSNKGSNKRGRPSSPTVQITAYNKQSKPDEITFIRNDNIIKEEEPTADLGVKELLFDQDLLQMTADNAEAYNIHFPMRRGELNLHSEIGGSMSSVLADLEVIWLYGICQMMKIDKSALVKYSAVLVVPDIYNRSHLRELVTLLLEKLKFRSCFVLQDSVASTFGAGLGYACVVDVGDQKCSVSCVDDGISQPDTRLRLPFGGGDISRVFYALLQRNAFPYKQCNVDKSLADAALISQQKERFCQFLEEYQGVQERNFEVKTTDGTHLRYTYQIGDESIVAPLAFFHTELLSITGKQRQACVQLTSSQQPDAEDCFDADYIRDTGRRNGMRGDQLEGNITMTGDNADDDLVVVDNYEMETTAKNNSEQKSDFAYTGTGQVLSLDQAIIRSIDRCSSDEMKRKMLGCILLVGGGVKLTGFVKYLEQKVYSSSIALKQRLNDPMPVEVNVFMREMDSTMIAWKGAAIMSCLESAPELWITPMEWEKFGLRILREKAAFIW